MDILVHLLYLLGYYAYIHIQTWVGQYNNFNITNHNILLNTMITNHEYPNTPGT